MPTEMPPPQPSPPLTLETPGTAQGLIAEDLGAGDGRGREDRIIEAAACGEAEGAGEAY